jgi:hypothetical protein
MNEDQLTRVRGRLKRRTDRLAEGFPNFFLPKLRRFWHYVTTEPFIAPILEELRLNKTPGTFQGISHQMQPSNTMALIITKSKEPLKTDEDNAACAYNVLKSICEYNGSDLTNIFEVRAEPGYLSPEKVFVPEYIDPFCDYLDERLDEQQAILGLMVRYKKRCEWFNKEALLKIAQDQEAKKENDKKRAEVEKVLKEDLYRYLHDQGIDFTIEPKSDRGEIDLILAQTGGDRRYLEGKVFDNEGRDAGYIVKGFRQLLHYLRQYNASNGYLLVYETCEEHLEIDGAEYVGDIPYIPCAGKTVFVIIVDIHQYAKPVSQRTSKPVRITADELIKADKPS